MTDYPNFSNMVAHPNRTFLADFTHMYDDKSKIHRTIIVAAKDEQTARDFLIEKLNFNPKIELQWLMNCNYPTIYDQTGKKPLEVQAKIVYNTHQWIDKYSLAKV